MKAIGIALSSALLAGAAAGPANATEANQWQVMTSKEDGTVITITTGTDNENGAYISCASDRLVVGVGVVPGSVKSLIEASSSERTRSQGAVTTFGDDSTDVDWIYFPGRKVALVRDFLTARKFYNAAVLGETLTWKTAFKDEVRVEFPETNDVFKSFANDCAVTNPDNQ